MPASLHFARLYADANGVSHFGEVETELVPRDFAPPAPPFSVSTFAPASACGFLQVPAQWVGEMHPSPARMWIFVLSGDMEFEASDGEVRTIRPGSALLLEDTAGAGHASRVIGNAAATLAAVRMPMDGQ